MADISALVFKGTDGNDAYVYEDSSCKLTFDLQNYAGTALGSGEISTATLTLIDRVSKTIMVTGDYSPVEIEDMDVSSGLSVGGVMTWYLEGESNIIVGKDKTKTETHLAIFKFGGTYAGQTVKLVQAIKVYIQNVETE